MQVAIGPLFRAARGLFAAGPSRARSSRSVPSLALRGRQSRGGPKRARGATRCRARGGLVLLFVSLLALPAVSRAETDDPFATNARLLASVRNDDTAGIARALRDGAAVNSRNRLGESALLMSLQKNRADIAQVLLDAGADVNEAAINGITPLMAAAFAGNVEMTRALLARGADTKAADRLGKNAITYAAGEGRTAVVRLLLDKGVDPNAAYRNDLTALMWAAGYGHADTVRALIEAGARVEPVDNRGKSALDMAREFKHASTVEVLEQALKRPRS